MRKFQTDQPPSSQQLSRKTLLIAHHHYAGLYRRIRHAPGRYCDLSLLHHLDFVDALRRSGSPSPRSLPSPCLGHPHPRLPYSARFRRGWNIHRNCDDQQQQEEGS